jgi:pimeloyl-ACP methyl ester carboxylesterase
VQEVLAREASAWGEFGGLMRDRIFWSPARIGEGRPVLVLPGLFGNDLYLGPLRSWLGRSGFRAIRSTLFVNAGCPERLTRRIETNLEKKLKDDERVIIIGHSRGGLLGRTLAARLQDRASHLVLLGSPVGGMTSWGRMLGIGQTAASKTVRSASDQARRLLDPECNAPNCGCPFPDDFMRSLHDDTQVISIYSPTDPIVPAAACKVPGGENIKVSGTHSGLAANVEVYRELADALRE